VRAARKGRAVGEAFDILWLTWDEAAASPDAVRYAGMLLRAQVLSRTVAGRSGGTA
jgi:hypothetical protein